MNLDSLHSLVSSAIWHAEQLEALQVSAAPLAWAEVSSLEEDLASALPVSQPEGRIARRGAVRAALKANDYPRARALAERYLGEKDTPEALGSAIREMLEQGSPERVADRSETAESRSFLRSWRITNVKGAPKGFPFEAGTIFLVGRQAQKSDLYRLVWLDQSGFVRTLDAVSLKEGQMEATLKLGADKLRIIGNVERRLVRIEGSIARQRSVGTKRQHDYEGMGTWTAEGVEGVSMGGMDSTREKYKPSSSPD